MSSPITIECENQIPTTIENLLKKINNNLPINTKLQPLSNKPMSLIPLIPDNKNYPTVHQNLPVLSSLIPLIPVNQNYHKVHQNLPALSSLNSPLISTNNQNLRLIPINKNTVPTTENIATNENIATDENIATNEKTLSVLLKNININSTDREQIYKILNKKNIQKPEQEITINTYDFSKNLWYISLSSIILTFLIIVILVLKWKDKNY